MGLSEEILNFKKARVRNKKIHISLTVVKDRLINIENAIRVKSEYFDLLSKSEQLDFMLYVLERFLSNSDIVDLETLDDRLRKING